MAARRKLRARLRIALTPAQRSGRHRTELWHRGGRHRCVGLQKNSVELASTPMNVWPRRQIPRILPRDVREFVERGLTRSLRSQVEGRYNTQGARRALPAEARVMGSAYLKQGDVVIASWAAGVEVLISTKTMLSSYAKNLRNRFEEGYGDAKNLRGRHPLSSLGFLFVAGADIPDQELDFAIDMLRKLTSRARCLRLLLLAALRSGGQGRDHGVGCSRAIDRPTKHLGSRTQKSSSCTTGRRRISRLVRSFGDSSPKRSPICR